MEIGLEADINRAIKRLDITRVIIAHRKETIESAGREIKLASEVVAGHEIVN